MVPNQVPAPPPQRPQSLDQLGFERQSFVRWFNPAELVRSGTRALLSELFGSFADKREIQAALQHSSVDAQLQYEDDAAGSDFWFDYVADVGDGFDATYSIALLLAQETLELGPERETTQRGRLLLMGGDEVYPTADRKLYLDRTTGPYRAAFPYLADEDKAPHLYALPGNHDWYDGLSAFLRQFTQFRWIGAWRSQQRRSYFARKLPRGVWLWGIDIQLHADIDSPQLEYFRKAADLLKPGDRVIVATAEPSWVKEAEGDRAGYQSLLLIMNKVPAIAKVVLVLTGDSHHYAHYSDPLDGVHFVTAGGGGAFLHGTHTLPQRIVLPTTNDASNTGRRRLGRGALFPSANESRRLIRRQIWRFPFTNWSFGFVWLVPWLWLGLSCWSEGVRRDIEGSGADITTRLAETLTEGALASRLPLLGALGLIFAVGVAIRAAFPTHAVERAAPEVHTERQTEVNEPFEWRKWVDILLWATLGGALLSLVTAGSTSPASVLLEVAQRSPSVALVVLLLPVGSALYVSRPNEPKEWPWYPRLLLSVGYGTSYVAAWLFFATFVAKLFAGYPLPWVLASALLGALSSMLLFGGCLWFAGQYQRALLNDAFSAIGVEDYKNFLRLRIDPEGRITVFAVGLRSVGRNWEPNPDQQPSAAFLRLKNGARLDPHLIETFDIPAR